MLGEAFGLEQALVGYWEVAQLRDERPRVMVCTDSLPNVEAIGRAAAGRSSGYRWPFLLRRLTWLAERCKADVVWQKAHVRVRRINEAINDQCDRAAIAARHQVPGASRNNCRREG